VLEAYGVLIMVVALLYEGRLEELYACIICVCIVAAFWELIRSSYFEL